MKHWPLNKAHFWETAPFFRALLPFAAGILCYDRGWLAIAGTNALVIISLAFLVYMAIVITNKSSNPLTFLLLSIIMFFSGSAISYFDDVRNNTAWFGNNTNTANVYLARITDIPSEKERSWKVPVSIESVIKDGKATKASGNAFLYLYKSNLTMLLHKGDSILVPGNWQPIKNAGNPFEFNYAANCRRNGIYYQQFCSVYNIRLYAANDPSAASFIDKGHDWCMQQLDKYITETKTKGLMQAMLLGDEVNLDEELLQSYSETGIVHIIAISGGNVAIFFIVISWLFWWLKHKKHLWVKYAIALPLVWIYVLMAGAAPSAIRAAVMFSLLAFSIMFQKNNNSLNQLLATAFVLLCAQPEWLFSLGFQLSFVAVLSLILFYKWVYKWISPANKIAALLWSVVAASIAAELLVAPLVIYYFHMFPLLFIVANVAAYLFMSLVLVLGIAIIALSFIPAVAQFIGACTVWIVTFFDKIVVWLQGFNPASFHFIMLQDVELLLVYVIITGAVLFLIKRQKAALFMSLAGACLLLTSFCNDEWISLHQHRLVIYNTTRASHIELVNGKTYTVLNTEIANHKKIAYTVKPAHTNWGAWQESNDTPSEVIDINGKTVLLLNREITNAPPFPVNYLFINYPEETDLVKLQKIFSPSLIIFGNNYSREQTDKFVKACADKNIPLHIIANDGAFVLN